MLAWSALLLAGIFEIVWAIGLKQTMGFSRLVPSVITLAAMGTSVVLLGYAVRTIPIGVGYAVWTGIGAAGTALVAALTQGEPMGLARVVFLGLILAGVVGLKVTSEGE